MYTKRRHYCCRVFRCQDLRHDINRKSRQIQGVFTSGKHVLQASYWHARLSWFALVCGLTDNSSPPVHVSTESPVRKSGCLHLMPFNLRPEHKEVVFLSVTATNQILSPRTPNCDRLERLAAARARHFNQTRARVARDCLSRLLHVLL